MERYSITTFQQYIGANTRSIAQFALSLALSVGWATGLLFGMYAWPLAIDHDVGSRMETIGGVYRPEQNDAFSYAYTNGDATLRLPHVGMGQFALSIRLGGPGGAVAVPAQLFVNGQSRDLGQVRAIRSYDMLATPDAQGGIELRLRSGTARLGNDPRALGLLLDRIELRSLGPTAPPPLLGLSMALVVVLAAAGVRRRGTLAQQRALLLALGAVLALVCLAGRGRFNLTAWWSLMILVGLVATVLQLSRLDARRLARPVVAVAVLFGTWRCMLWSLAAIGLHYSAALARVKELTGGDDTNFAGVPLIRAALADAWVHWDSTAYIAIATSGYTFRGERWPSIAFFPLYPLLMRFLSFSTGLSVPLAALLLAQAAFFGALLLLYHLLAADFGSAIAYRSVLLLVVCPTSFFFAAAYTESLTLLLLVAAVWALRRQRWWLAGGLGFLLALARLPGVLIAPILVFAYMQAIGWRWRAIRAPIAAALLPPAGLALFMLFQWRQFGTPFAFMIAQQSWHNELSPPWVLPKALFEHMFVYDNWPLAAFQSVFYVAFLVLTVGALLRLPLLYSLTLLLFLLPPYLSSWPWSVSRHVLLGFPAFTMLALWVERLWLRQLLIMIMLALLAIGAILFVNGVLVA